jgi:uncharacterized protein YjbI with pentapeptide repeats
LGFKAISIIVIWILLLNIIFMSYNLDLEAYNLNHERNIASIAKSNNRFSNNDFNWGQIEVISEIVISQNININYSNDPAIAVENDKIYVVWNDRTNISNNGADYDIFYRYFNGSIWSEIQIISEPIPNKDVSRFDSVLPDITVKNSKIYVVWKDYNNISNSGLDADIFCRCNLTGNGWENIQILSEPIQDKNINIGDCLWPKIAVENGKIYAVWQDNNNTNNAGTDYDIFYRCNLTGMDWEDIQIISEPLIGANKNTGNSEWADIVVNNNKIYTVWSDRNNTDNAGTDSDIFFKCNLTGSSWEPVQIISEPFKGKNINMGGSSFPSITVEDNKIYVVWYDLNNTIGAGTDSDIFYRCNLTGLGWEEVQVISEPVQNQNFNTADSTNPEIAVENGNIYVVWMDNNDTDGSSNDMDIFYRCNLNGLSWEEVQVISEPVTAYNFNTGQSNWPDIVVNHGKSHIIWVDNNNTDGSGVDDDIFYRWIKDPLPLYLNYPTVIPTSGNTSTVFNFTITYTHLNNKPPIGLTVNISGIEYPMLEVDPADNNFLNGKEYYFNIKNLEIGSHTYQYCTFDGEFDWFTPVMNNPKVVNTHPNILTKDNITAYEDVYYKIDYEYEDIDNINIGQPGLWNFSTNASWLEFNYTMDTLKGTPTNDDVGEYWVNIAIFDTIDIDFTNFTLSVINVNDAPIIITNDTKITNEDELYEVTYQAIDIDTKQKNLVWKMNTNASWLQFDEPSAILIGTPTNDDVGTFWLNISVSDNEYIDFTNFTLRVININDPPMIITIDNLTAYEDDLYEMFYLAEDVDNTPNQLIWSIITNADWLKTNNFEPTMNGTPTNDDIGEYWVNVTVNDGEFIDFSNFTLTVINTNDPPSIISEDKLNISEGELYSVNYEAEDIDPPPITLTWSIKTNTSNWLTVDAITGWLNGVPGEDDAGIYWVNISVTDGAGGWDFHNFTLTVIDVSFIRNKPPILSNVSVTPSKGNIKTIFTFSIHYFDPDGDLPSLIQIVIDDIPRNMKLKTGENASNGVYELSTTLTKGDHSYYFMASDGSEIIKTNITTIPNIKDINKIEREDITWLWIVIIVICIILFITFIWVYKTKESRKVQVVKAELIPAPPQHILPTGTISSETPSPLPAPSISAEQLPTSADEGLIPTIVSEKVPTPSLAPTPVKPEYQLPQETLSTSQQLGLLKERFLRGEVSEETYKELKAGIEAKSNTDITLEDHELEDYPNFDEPSQVSPIESESIIETEPFSEELPPSPEVETQDVQPTIVQQDLPSPEQNEKPSEQIEKKENEEE